MAAPAEHIGGRIIIGWAGGRIKEERVGRFDVVTAVTACRRNNLVMRNVDRLGRIGRQKQEAA